MGTQVQSSWADEIEDGDTNTLPLPSEKIVDNKKYTTEYSINDDGKKIKIVRTFEIIKKQVPKSVAMRKALDKFGMSRNDRPGTPTMTFLHFKVSQQVLYRNLAKKSQNLTKGEKSRESLFTF